MRRALPALALLFVACGPSIPRRFVLERDVAGWSYRRYQEVLDVELPIEGNPAVGHTATYVRRPGRRETSVPFANVFVTVYEHPEGLAELVRRRVRSLASYEVELRDIGGHCFFLDAGPGDRWALWVSGVHVVKVGASEEVDGPPEDVVREYMGIYGSDLDEHGRAREGTPSAGEPPDPTPTPETEGDDEVPHFLRENAPR